MDDVMMSLGPKLRAAREKAGLTQVEVATALKVKQPTYAQYEAGTRVPSLEIFRQICKVFGLSADFLLFGDDKDVEGAEGPRLVKQKTATDGQLIVSLHEELLAQLRNIETILQDKLAAEEARTDDLIKENQKMWAECSRWIQSMQSRVQTPSHK